MVLLLVLVFFFLFSLFYKIKKKSKKRRKKKEKDQKEDEKTQEQEQKERKTRKIKGSAVKRSGEKGFEPLTSGFGDHCSTIETIPLSQGLRLVFISSQKMKKEPHFLFCAFGLFLFKKKKTK